MLHGIGNLTLACYCASLSDSKRLQWLRLLSTQAYFDISLSPYIAASLLIALLAWRLFAPSSDEDTLLMIDASKPSLSGASHLATVPPVCMRKIGSAPRSVVLTGGVCPSLVISPRDTQRLSVLLSCFVTHRNCARTRTTGRYARHLFHYVSMLWLRCSLALLASRASKSSRTQYQPATAPIPALR